MLTSNPNLAPLPLSLRLQELAVMFNQVCFGSMVASEANEGRAA